MNYNSFKELSESKLKEVEHLKEWCLFILKFIIEKSGDNIIFNNLIYTTINLYERKDIRGLKYAFREVNEMSKGLSLDELYELNLLLKKEFGENFENNNIKLVKKVNSIIKRGKINNEEEFRLLEIRMDDIYADDKNKDEIKIIDNLLADYNIK